MAHEAQVRYSNLVDLKLRKTLVKKVGVICNNRYEGSPKAGSVKVPVRDTEVVVNDYDKAKGAKQTSGDTTYLTVNIDHDKAVNEIIDGFDAESVPGNLVADRLDSAGYSLGLQMDSDGSVELTTAGTAFGNTTALTEKTIYANIVDARTQQSSIGVPTAGRWLLVSPDTYGLLLKSPEFIKASDLGDAVVQTGAVGKIAGYTVFEDSTLGSPSSMSGPFPSTCRISPALAISSAHLPCRAAKSTPTRSPRARPFLLRRRSQHKEAPMLYCTYDQYQTAGGTLDEAAFTPLCFRASKLIDRATFGRAEAHTKGCADCAEALAMACASIVQSLERAEAARAATGYAPGVTSVNNDGFAVTFSDGALAEKQAAEAHSILSGCLGHDPHGLLYRGCF